MANSDCIFCQIIRGDAPATIVYQDDVVVVFLDINPVTPGHLLVVPRVHLQALADIDTDTGTRMFDVALRMAAVLRESGLRCEGINLFYADGEVAFQEVFHAHLHVFPRYQDDGFKFVADWDNKPRREELEAVGNQIRKTIQRKADTSSSPS